MSDTPVPAVPRPPLAFRVGVTGALALDPEAVKSIRPAVAQILNLISEELMRLAGQRKAQLAYAPAAAGAAALRLVSPLAEGSDRLVAEEALTAGYQLYAPLPFLRAEYEKDFPQTVEPFRKLLARAETLELDGDRDGQRNESYQEVGRFVVRNCDLLIAIWDGQRERGPGGTAEVVRFAAQAGLPVWWIDANGAREPRLIDSPSQLTRPDLSPAGDDAVTAVKTFLEKTIVPPSLPPPERVGLFGFAARWLARLNSDNASPLIDYLSEQPLSPSPPWRAYDWMMKIVARGVKASAPGLGEGWWATFHAAADQFSLDYGARYRSSYVLIAALAFLALAAASPRMPKLDFLEHFLGAVEVLTLLGIGFLVLANQLRRWHERWISYRFLAELCRKQYVLSAIGQTLPRSEIVHMSLDAAEAREALPREAWVAWYFTAALRAAPFLTGSLAAAKQKSLALAQSLIAQQSAYHHGRRERDRAASRRIDEIGQICFVLTAVLIVAKVLFFSGHHPTTIELCATLAACLSAASGALVGIRAYSEFSLLVQQSQHMLRILKEKEIELAAMKENISQPLASRDLGRAMYELAMEMLHDVNGWAQLFRIKTLEA